MTEEIKDILEKLPPTTENPGYCHLMAEHFGTPNQSFPHFYSI
jgi:hypothetical protein